jgi:2-polyprenyl-6-methoxyphenol hydroxylase-like FAD-dependent oxidoreductase
LVIAHLLQREAIPCVVLERHTLADLGQHPKAGLIEYRTVASLQRERSPGHPAVPGGECRCNSDPRGSVVLDYGAYRRAPSFASIRHQLVSALRSAGRTGGEIRFGHCVLAVTRDSGGAVL